MRNALEHVCDLRKIRIETRFSYPDAKVTSGGIDTVEVYNDTMAHGQSIQIDLVLYPGHSKLAAPTITRIFHQITLTYANLQTKANIIIL